MKNKSTNPKNGLWTASYGKIGATLKALQDYGVTLEHLARICAEPEFAKRVAEYILCGGIKYPERAKSAKTLMGKNFFGIEDWIYHYMARFSNEQLCHITEFPWSEHDLLSTCPLCCRVVKDCHFAFLGLNNINGDPLTIIKLKELHPETGQPRFIDYDPHPKGKHLTKTMDFKWYMAHINAVPESQNKNFKEQKKCCRKAMKCRC